MLPLILAMAVLTSQQQDAFVPPETVGLGLPATGLLCSNPSKLTYIVTVEFDEGRNRFDLVPFGQGGKVPTTSDAIGGVLGTPQGQDRLSLRIRPKSAANTELVLAVVANQPLTATLTLDGGKTKLTCEQVPTPPVPPVPADRP